MEYRVDFNESKIESLGVIKGVLDSMRATGNVIEVISEKSYYWIPKTNVEGLWEMLSEHKGVCISKLQGKMLRAG